MVDGRVVRCPNCGGVVSEGGRLCGFCGAHVATVRCGNCYHMNAADTVHCSGCGREVGLEPVGCPDPSRCPSCAAELEMFRGGPGKLLDCGRCGGQFVEHALLRDLVERREVYGAAAPRRLPKGNPLADPVRYVKCPECDTIMTRRNFGGSSGIVVDVCGAHGTWFDDGELPRVLAFVESGGLAAARRREIEEERRRVSTLRTEAVTARTGASSPPDTTVVDAAMELLDLVMKWMH